MLVTLSLTPSVRWKTDLRVSSLPAVTLPMTAWRSCYSCVHELNPLFSTPSHYLSRFNPPLILAYSQGAAKGKLGRSLVKAQRSQLSQIEQVSDYMSISLRSTMESLIMSNSVIYCHVFLELAVGRAGGKDTCFIPTSPHDSRTHTN